MNMLNVQKEELNMQVQGAGCASSLICPQLGYPESKLEIFTCNASRDLKRLKPLPTVRLHRSHCDEVKCLALLSSMPCIIRTCRMVVTLRANGLGMAGHLKHVGSLQNLDGLGP